MSTYEIAVAKSYGTIDDAIATLNLDAMRTAAMAETLAGRLRRLMTIYVALRPLLTSMTALPLFAQTWRTAVALFVETLDAIVAAPEVDPDFKAGKDL